MAYSRPTFGTLVKPTRKRVVDEFNYLEHKDRRMRFNNAKDPIYYIFSCVEDRPIKVLAKEFVKDTVFDIMSFVSRVVA